MDDIEIEKKARGPVHVDIKQMSKILSEFKTRIESSAARRGKRLLILFAVGFALCISFCFIIFRISFSSYENSFREEIKTLEQKVGSLEQSLDRKIDGALKDIQEDINKTLSEISANSAFASDTAKEIDTEFLLPQLDTSFKSYMDYRTITCTASEQYALQKQAYTDSLGLREIDGFYCIALGTYYSSQCGDKFKIRTDSGNEFYVIVADIKDDRHTDDSNMYVPLSNGAANVIEFIVDTSAIERRVALLGDISGYEQFSGNIVKIERV